jgi:formate/nitrite transporter FocA (FNT family)
MSREADLKNKHQDKVEELEEAPASVVFEAIRRQGEYELFRPISALWWSGVVAGLAISLSVLCKGILISILPQAQWVPGISNLGYTIGFLVVILARMQLFTENTITPILPLFQDPSKRKLIQIGRLWLVVLVANMVGCSVAALMLSGGYMLPAERFEGVLVVARHYAEATAFEHFMWGIPAGFIIAALVWIIPRMEGAGEVLMIITLTYMIGLGGFSHVVAGATELFLLLFRGELSVWETLGQGIAPALAGNIIGGTGIFAALTYAQLRQEI